MPRPLTKSGWSVVVLFLSVLDGCLKLVNDAVFQAKCFFSTRAVEWNEAHVVHVNLLPCFVSSFRLVVVMFVGVCNVVFVPGGDSR